MKRSGVPNAVIQVSEIHVIADKSFVFGKTHEHKKQESMNHISSGLSTFAPFRFPKCG
jgi:hypothetical protein